MTLAPLVLVVVLTMTGLSMRIAVLVVVVGVVVPLVDVGLVVIFEARTPLLLVEWVEWFLVFDDIFRLVLLGQLDDLVRVCGSTPRTPRWSSCFGVGGRCLWSSSVLRIRR